MSDLGMIKSFEVYNASIHLLQGINSCQQLTVTLISAP